MTLLQERSTTTHAGAMPHEFHWTATAFYQAERLGVFKEPNQLELIHGRIIEKMPQGPLHRAAVSVSAVVCAPRWRHPWMS